MKVMINNTVDSQCTAVTSFREGEIYPLTVYFLESVPHTLFLSGAEMVHKYKERTSHIEYTESVKYNANEELRRPSELKFLF